MWHGHIMPPFPLIAFVLFPCSLLWWPSCSFHYFLPPQHCTLFSFHFPLNSHLLFCTRCSSRLFSPLHPPPSSYPPFLLRASGCLPTSDVLLARWCMQISCVFLTLTHVDICTALWDYALGHISCNDENDDENSGEAENPWVGVGYIIYFLPLSFFSINQCSELRWCNWVFAEIVEGIASKSRDGFHFHFVTFQHAEGGDMCLHSG